MSRRDGFRGYFEVEGPTGEPYRYRVYRQEPYTDYWRPEYLLFVDPGGEITEGIYLNTTGRPLPEAHAVLVITEVLDCFWFNAVGVQAQLRSDVAGATVYYSSEQGETTLFRNSVGVVVPIDGAEREVTVELFDGVTGRVLRTLTRTLRAGDYEVWTTALPYDPP